MAEVAFRPVCQLSEYKGKGASASREARKSLRINSTPSAMLSSNVGDKILFTATLGITN